jgi:hypothetical protein
MNTVLVLDIETIPADDARIVDFIAASIKPPKTMSVAATIEKWHKDSKQDAIDDAVSGTGLDGAFGRVCVIGFDMGEGVDALHGLDEPALLVAFNAKLNTIPRSLWSAMTIVGHNVIDFDLRFLVQRYMVNGIQPHAIIQAAARAKPWDTNVYDTMIQFAGLKKSIRLDKLCMALGVTSPKSEMDGSMVGQFVADGRIAEVVEYCKRDVTATGAVYRRMTFGVSKDLKHAVAA